jgi:hypothetical protein
MTNKTSPLSLTITYSDAVRAAVALAVAGQQFGSPSITVTGDHCLIVRFADSDHMLIMDNAPAPVGVGKFWAERNGSANAYLDHLAWAFRLLLNTYGLLPAVNLLDEAFDRDILCHVLGISTADFDDATKRKFDRDTLGPLLGVSTSYHCNDAIDYEVTEKLIAEYATAVEFFAELRARKM